MIIEGERIYLTGISEPDEAYLRWMEDNEVTKYLETRFNPSSVGEIQHYLDAVNSNAGSFMFAIMKGNNLNTSEHIGNIKLGPIDWLHRFSSVGLLIGEKRLWGQGYGTEAIKIVVKFAFETLNLHKLTAGCYKENIASIRAFQKAGFTVEGELKSQYLLEGKYTSGILLGLVNEGT